MDSYYKDTDLQKAQKAYALISVILTHARLSAKEREFLLYAQNKIRYGNGRPTVVLTEFEARKVRAIAFKKKGQYHRFLNPLPDNVPFEDEVRRILKEKPSPNERRNKKIQDAKRMLESRGLKDVKYRFTVDTFRLVFTGFDMRARTSIITDRPHYGPHPVIAVVYEGKYEGRFSKSLVNLNGEHDAMDDKAMEKWFQENLKEVATSIRLR